jgi:hypothetical protein
VKKPARKTMSEHPSCDYCGDCEECGCDSEDPRTRYPECSACGEDAYSFEPKVSWSGADGKTYWFCSMCAEKCDRLDLAKTQAAKVKQPEF